MGQIGRVTLFSLFFLSFFCLFCFALFCVFFFDVSFSFVFVLSFVFLVSFVSYFFEFLIHSNIASVLCKVSCLYHLPAVEHFSHTLQSACMHACKDACMYVCMYVCMHVCILAFLNTLCMYVYVHIYTINSFYISIILNIVIPAIGPLKARHHQTHRFSSPQPVAAADEDLSVPRA